MERFLVVLVGAEAADVDQAKVMLRPGVALLGGLGPPLDGLLAVDRDPAALVVHHAEVVLGEQVAGLGERLPDLLGGLEVAGLVGLPAGIEVIAEGRPGQARQAGQAQPEAQGKGRQRQGSGQSPGMLRHGLGTLHSIG